LHFVDGKRKVEAVADRSSAHMLDRRSALRLMGFFDMPIVLHDREIPDADEDRGQAKEDHRENAPYFT
jgi:hypothetical protein